MATRVRIPQATALRRSVEVQHASKGVGRMLRRGLHGSKNWVLETEEDGEHRSVWSKLFRAAVVLMPAWIVLSAATGGPERGGGQSVSIFRSLVAAVLVLLVGLAVFSARERRQGHEEPWADLPPVRTQSEDEPVPPTEETGDEEGTQILENSQVEESGSDDAFEEGDDEKENSAETPQIEQPDLRQIPQQAISPEAKTLVAPTPEAPTRVLPQVVQQAISAPSNSDKVDSSFDVIASVATDFHSETSQQTIPEPAFSLVKDDVEPMREPLQEATPEWTNLDVSLVTDGDDGLIGDEPTTPLRTAVQEPLREGGDATESVQVSLVKEPVQQPLQGVLQVQFAEAGPYPAKADPVHEQWWVVAPDIETEEAEDEATAPEEQDVLGGATEGRPELPRVAVGRHPQVVLAYHASQAPKSGFTNEEKDQAKAEAIAWLKEEIGAGHLSRAEASRMLGVDPSTVTRWLSDDPWGG